MSYQGSEERICKTGHYYSHDAYDAQPERCPDCNAAWAWYHQIDETNGPDDENPDTFSAPTRSIGRGLFAPDSPAWVSLSPELRATEKQIDGEHYVSLAIQPTEYILANKLGWCEANVVKYVSRWKSKGGVSDLRKAAHYLEMLIERTELTSKDYTPRPSTDLAPDIKTQVANLKANSSQPAR